MKTKIVFLIVIFSLIFTLKLYADTYDQRYQRQIRVDLIETGTPLIPRLSRIQAEMPSSVFFSKGFLTRFNLHAWYLAYSPFLWPATFFELGMVIDFEIFDKKKFGLDGGIGTGFSITEGVSSVPLILDIRSQYAPLSWLQIEAIFEFFIWGEGQGVEGKINADFMPFKYPIILEVGGGYTALWNDFNTVGAFQIHLGAGYIFDLGGGNK